MREEEEEEENTKKKRRKERKKELGGEERRKKKGVRRNTQTDRKHDKADISKPMGNWFTLTELHSKLRCALRPGLCSVEASVCKCEMLPSFCIPFW